MEDVRAKEIVKSAVDTYFSCWQQSMGKRVVFVRLMTENARRVALALFLSDGFAMNEHIHFRNTIVPREQGWQLAH